jgi:hypothetical protein
MAPTKLLSARAGTHTPLQQPSVSAFLSANNPDAQKFNGDQPTKKKKKASSGIGMALRGNF